MGINYANLEKLRLHLLTMGGDATSDFGGLQRHDFVAGEICCGKEVEMLLAAKPISGKGAKLMPMQTNDCHGNAAALARLRRGWVHMTGFALSDDGLWRIHSWVSTPSGIIETTVPRETYVGIKEMRK